MRQELRPMCGGNGEYGAEACPRLADTTPELSKNCLPATRQRNSDRLQDWLIISRC